VCKYVYSRYFQEACFHYELQQYTFQKTQLYFWYIYKSYILCSPYYVCIYGIILVAQKELVSSPEELLV